MRFRWAVVALVAAVASGCSGGDEPVTTGSSSASPALRQVLYEVESPDGLVKGADVTLSSGTGTQQKGVAVPMGREGEAPGVTVNLPAGELAYISAQSDEVHGQILCRITVDGVVLSENVSSGSYAVVTCKGSIP